MMDDRLQPLPEWSVSGDDEPVTPLKQRLARLLEGYSEHLNTIHQRSFNNGAMPEAISLLKAYDEKLERARVALEWMRTETSPPVHGSMADMPTINAVWEVANEVLRAIDGEDNAG